MANFRDFWDNKILVSRQCSRQAAPLRDYRKKIGNGAEIFTVCAPKGILLASLKIFENNKLRYFGSVLTQGELKRSR